MPVVKTSTLHRFVGNIEAQRSDQVQPTAGGSAGSGDVAAVLRDLRFVQNDIEQEPHLAYPIYLQKTCPIIVFQNLQKINPKKRNFSTFTLLQ